MGRQLGSAGAFRPDRQGFVVVVSGIQPEKAQTPIAWERPATLASDTPRPLYGKKTPKKLVGFNVSFRTVHWTRISHASVTVGVCFYFVERSWSARRKEQRRACSEQTNREFGILKKKQKKTRKIFQLCF